MGIRIVKNYPSPRLMENIGATNQTTQEAIGELVANSLDARIPGEPIKIDIDIRGDEIAIIDNGKGMTFDVLENAVCIAEDMSKYVEKPDSAKGFFGMGFKTSCSTLGYYYEIYTRPIGEEVEYHVEFDIAEYANRPNGADAWDVKIEDNSPNPSSPLGKAKHGTAFVVSKLKDNQKYPSAIRNYLERAFKPEIKNGAEIVIIDDSGEYRAEVLVDEYIRGSRIEIDEVFGPNNKYHITGWMALNKQTNNDGNYGFNIYRKKQLVAQYDKSWFTAHLMTSRIFDEVNMDFLDATFYKQGVQQASEGWLYSKIHMTQFLKDMVSASRDISRGGNVNNQTEVKRIVSKLNTAYHVVEPVSTPEVHEDATYGSGEAEGTSTTSIHDSIRNVISEDSLILQDQGTIQIAFFEQENDNNTILPFDYIFSDLSEDDDNQKAELQVIVYKNHPLWKKKIDDETRSILAIQDSIYRMLVEKLQYDSSKALKIRNEWLTKRLG